MHSSLLGHLQRLPGKLERRQQVALVYNVGTCEIKDQGAMAFM